MSLGLHIALIHRSAWKEDSPNFALQHLTYAAGTHEGVQLIHERRRRRTQRDAQAPRGGRKAHRSVSPPYARTRLGRRSELPKAASASVGGPGHDGNSPQGSTRPTRGWL